MRAGTAVCVLVLVAKIGALPAGAELPVSRLAYAQKCAEEMGVIAEFNCLEGDVIPITLWGQAVSSATDGETCDKPVQLGTGDSQCVPFSRFLRIHTANANVETVVICRKYVQNDNGPDDTKFSDIAMIAFRNAPAHAARRHELRHRA